MLKELELDKNGILDAGATALLEGLEVHPKLTAPRPWRHHTCSSCYVAGRNATQRGFHPTLSCHLAQWNTSVRYLSLRQNYITAPLVMGLTGHKVCGGLLHYH